jgi:uncharacterized protein YukE
MRALDWTCSTTRLVVSQVLRQKRKIIFVLFFTGFCSAALFARGKMEEEMPKSLNNEFILCIADFDVSALPPSQQILGSVMQRELVSDISRIHHRKRNDDEVSRYEELATTAAMKEAAAALSKKRAERDALLYQGAADWKYNKEIKRIDKELEELEEAYKKAVEEIPLVAEKPVFKISQTNIEGNFPPPPQRGEEEVFLKTNSADALLEGKFRLVYGRVYAEFRFFIHGASFVYEDSTIFSQEDLNIAADELKERFLTTLANSQPARLLLSAEPEYAQLELNGKLVKSGEVIELSPGPVTVRATADDHQSAVKEMELEEGDSDEIAFVLKPFTMETLDITLDKPGSLVYMGALFLGGNRSKITENKEQRTNEEGEIASDETADDEITANEITADGEVVSAEAISDEMDEIAEEITELKPGFFSVYIPVGQYRYIRIETEDGLTGEAIVKGSSEDTVRIITLAPRKLPGKDEKPVENKRKKFYGAYGRLWVALPIAFLASGFSAVYTNSFTIGGKQDMFNNARTMYYVSIGTWVITGIFLAESLIRMGFYVHSASNEAIPLWE